MSTSPSYETSSPGQSGQEDSSSPESTHRDEFPYGAPASSSTIDASHRPQNPPTHPSQYDEDEEELRIENESSFRGEYENSVFSSSTGFSPSSSRPTEPISEPDSEIEIEEEVEEEDEENDEDEEFVIHGEISNPPSPLGGGSTLHFPTRRPESPESGPSYQSGSVNYPDSPSNNNVNNKLNVHNNVNGRSRGGSSGGSSSSKRFRHSVESEEGLRSDNSGVEPGPSRLMGPPPPPPNSSEATPAASVTYNYDDSHEHRAQSPSLPDSVISSSTGHFRSPCTPLDIHGDNDLSVPSPINAIPWRRDSDDESMEELIDSTVDSSGLSFFSPTPLPPNDDSLGGLCQSSRDVNSSDDEDETREEDETQRKNSLVSLPPLRVSNDGISTSGQVDGGNDEPVAGPSGYSRNHLPSSSSNAPSLSLTNGKFPYEELRNETQSSNISSDGLNIGQAFSGFPQSLLTSQPVSSSVVTGTTASVHSSILETLSGPLSKRLRRLHTLEQEQQQQIPHHSDEATSFEDSATNNVPSSSSSNNNNNNINNNNNTNHNNNNNTNNHNNNNTHHHHHNISIVDIEGENDRNNNLPSSSGNGSNANDEESSDPHPSSFLGGTQQTYSLMIETNSVSKIPTSSLLIPERNSFTGGVKLSRESKPNFPTLPPHPLLYLQSERLGVFAKNPIPSNYSFEPFENFSENIRFFHKIDEKPSDKEHWMRFVRPTQLISQSNIHVSKIGNSIVFKSVKAIDSDNELRVSSLETKEKTQDEESCWLCFHCNVNFSTSNKLQIHLNANHKGKKTFKSTKNSLKSLYKCQNCFKGFDTRISLARHVLLHHETDRVYRCEMCSLHFSHPYNYNRHVHKVHGGSNSSYTCSTCGLWFKYPSSFVLHSSSDKVESKGFECPECFVRHESSQDYKELSKFMRKDEVESSNSYTIPCDLCLKSFASKERLTRHTRTMHSINSSSLLSSKLASVVKEKSYDCPICGLLFDQVMRLKEHVHVHRIDGRYLCPHCNKAFPMYALIRKHIRSFHAEKKFQCVQCDMSFTGADKLKIHVVKHSDVKEFLCNECGKQFKRKDKLKEHNRRLHPPLKSSTSSTSRNSEANYSSKFETLDVRRFIYKCIICVMGFKRRGMLVNHLAKRHPEMPLNSVPELNLPILKTTRDYYCQYCNKVYKSSSKRKSHILKNHPGSELPISVRSKSQEMNGNNATFSACVGSVTFQPQHCLHCHKQYASKAKLLQHLRKEHSDMDVVHSHIQQEQRSENYFAPLEPCSFSVRKMETASQKYTETSDEDFLIQHDNNNASPRMSDSQLC